ncbi:Arm DNA-binding domain-containing protein [Pseudomonas fluorescens]|nr:Arm DNA-binding domain-containing protein [Pseudomonas fluorescens]
MPLTDTTVRHAKNHGKNYSLKDMGGLHLFVSAKGVKSWHFRCYWLGRQIRISLGMYPAIGLEEARRAHDQSRATGHLREPAIPAGSRQPLLNIGVAFPRLWGPIPQLWPRFQLDKTF